MRAVTRRTALTGAGAGLATAIIAACGGSSSPSDTSAQSSTASGGTPVAGIFGAKGKLKFVFVNHVTTNPFFVPTKYGAEDACKLLGCSYQWTGSEKSNVKEIVNALNAPITGGGGANAVCLLDDSG